MRDAKGRFINNHKVPIEWKLSLSKLFKERGYRGHPNWKGGISINRLRFYDSIEWEEMKKKILKRDNHLCQICGSHKKLEVHYVFPFSSFPELRLVEWNLITVCQTCHKKLTKIFHPNKWVIIYEN